MPNRHKETQEDASHRTLALGARAIEGARTKFEKHAETIGFSIPGRAHQITAREKFALNGFGQNSSGEFANLYQLRVGGLA